MKADSWRTACHLTKPSAVIARPAASEVILQGKISQERKSCYKCIIELIKSIDEEELPGSGAKNLGQCFKK